MAKLYQRPRARIFRLANDVHVLVEIAIRDKDAVLNNGGCYTSALLV